MVILYKESPWCPAHCRIHTVGWYSAARCPVLNNAWSDTVHYFISLRIVELAQFNSLFIEFDCNVTTVTISATT